MIPAVVGALLLHAMPAISPPSPVPFRVGESFEYRGYHSLNPFGGVGSAIMTVAGIDTVAGVPTWPFSLTTKVSIPFYKNTSVLESWTTVSDFVSHRVVHHIIENGKLLANDDYRIHGDSGFYRNHNDALTKPTPRDALDDLAFVYYIRAMDLHADSVYRIPRYFRTDHNPVTVTVVGHDSVEMPDGSRCYCWLLHPVVDEPGGLFSKKSEAQLWLTDDGLRIPVQIKSKISVGTVTLKLRKITRGR
jgi:hypothetical protein